MKHESHGDTICCWGFPYTHQRIGTGTGGLVKMTTSGDHPNYGIVQIDQNTKKNTGDLKRLAVTQTPVRNNPLMVVWKTIKD